MPMRVLSGLALWLALAALPAFHSGARGWLVLAAVAPLPLLAFPKTALLFVAAFLPLYAVRPDLMSPRVYGSGAILAAAALLSGYLVMALRAPVPPGGPRPIRRHHHRVGTMLVMAAAGICALAVTAPYLGPVVDAVRQGYPADPGAVTVLLALGTLALAAGLVLAYVAAPLDDVARGR